MFDNDKDEGGDEEKEDGTDEIVLNIAEIDEFLCVEEVGGKDDLEEDYLELGDD